MPESLAQSVDVAVVGAGMVGTALALGLADAGFSVALLEAREPQPWQQDAPVDLRVSAISPASIALLEQLQIWPAVQAMRCCDYQHMAVFDAGGPGQLQFSATDAGVPFLGSIVENGVLTTAMLARAKTLANVRWLCPVQLQTITWGADSAELQLADGRTISAALVVGADGAKSAVRGMAGIDVAGWDYARQRAVVAVVQTAQAHAHTAWQRFLPAGPLAFLPLSDGSCSIVWSTTPEQAETLLADETDHFAAALGQAAGSMLGAITAVGPRASFPLRLQLAETFAAPRCVLVGDAAHSIHPLAGQGVNLGLMDVAELLGVLERAGRRRRDIGQLGTLRRYARARKAEAAGMAALTEACYRGFALNQPLPGLLRGAGMRFINRAPPLKRWLLQQALRSGLETPGLLRKQA